MESKEKLKDFNQRFTTLLNNISTASRPIYEVLIEFYIFCHLITIATFVKRIGRYSLQETYDEEVKVEKDMVSLKGNHSTKEMKSHLHLRR